jgi:hypothetical protein
MMIGGVRMVEVVGGIGRLHWDLECGTKGW